MPKSQTAEHARLAEATGRAEDDLFSANPWYEWGPYLSERAWGTVREDYSESGDAWDSFPHDHARSRAYRWNEDGMAGDLRHPPRALPRARALERQRPDPEGAHVRAHRAAGQPRRGRQGVLVVPRRAAEPRAPEVALPLPAGRVPVRAAREPRPRPRRPGARAARHGRVRRRPLLVGRRHLREGLADRGADADRAREPRPRRGDAATCCRRSGSATPGRGARRPSGRGSTATARRSSSPSTRSPATGSTRRPAPDGAAPEALFCENETNAPRVFGAEPTTPYPKDGINDHVVSGAATVNPEGFGTKAALRYRVTRGGRRQGRAPAPAPPARDEAEAVDLGRHRVRRGRRRPRGGRRRVLRRARAAGHRRGADADPAPGLRRARLEQADVPVQRAPLARRRPRRAAPPEAHRHGRNSGWRHLDAFDVLAMPDPWEYPWFAAWDLGLPLRSPGRTSIPRSRSTSWSCCCASGSSTRTGRSPPTSGTSTTSTRPCT